MNKFFTNIGPKLSSKITTPNHDYLRSINLSEHSKHKLSEWRPLNISEIENLIKDIDINKGSNIKNINTKLFKDCLTAIPDKLLFLFNKVFSDGEFPDSWKVGCVVPIFKSGNRKKVNNYRPITLLPIVGKLVEKLMHRRILAFLDDYKFFRPFQNGFSLGQTIVQKIHLRLYLPISTLN